MGIENLLDDTYAAIFDLIDIIKKLWIWSNNTPMVYIIFTGLLVYCITDKLNKNKELRKLKEDIFISLFSNFDIIEDYDNLKKFKLIPIIFRDNEKIVEFFKEYSQKSDLKGQNPTQEEMDILVKRLDEIRESILYEIAVDLKIIKKSEKLIHYAYKPIWLDRLNEITKSQHFLLKNQEESVKKSMEDKDIINPASKINEKE